MEELRVNICAFFFSVNILLDEFWAKMVHHPNMDGKVSICEEEKGSYSERIDFSVQEISLFQVDPQFALIEEEHD